MDRGFNFSLFTILHTTVEHKAAEACQRQAVRTVISNWTLCHPVTAKVLKRLWSHGNKLERVPVAMDPNARLTTFHCSWILRLVKEGGVVGQFEQAGWGGSWGGGGLP